MYADAHIKRAAIFAGLCELDRCHEEFEAAITAKPDHADIYIQRARVSIIVSIIIINPSVGGGL